MAMLEAVVVPVLHSSVELLQANPAVLVFAADPEYWSCIGHTPDLEVEVGQDNYNTAVVVEVHSEEMFAVVFGQAGHN